MYYLVIKTELDILSQIKQTNLKCIDSTFFESTHTICLNDELERQYEKKILTLNNLIFAKYQVLQQKDKTEYTIVVLKPNHLCTISNFIFETETFNYFKINKTDLKNKIIKNIKLYETDCLKKGKSTRSEIIFETNPEIFETKDVVEDLYKTNELYRALTVKGTNIIGPKMTELYRFFERLYKIKLKELSFKEIMLPKFETFETWGKSGHIKFPENHYIVTRFEPEISVLQKYKIEGYLKRNWTINKSDLTNPYFGVSYAQCPSFWPSLEGISLNNARLPIKYFDDSGFTGRVEGNAIKSIERLNFFSRIELLFIEKEIRMHQLIQDIITKYKEVYNSLNLKYRILKVESWMDYNEESTQTYDFEAYIPWNNKWLEIANVSDNGTVFLKNFKVNVDKDVNSGCSGIGKERIAYAFLSQKGLDIKNWPQFMKNELNINLFEKLY